MKSKKIMIRRTKKDPCYTLINNKATTIKNAKEEQVRLGLTSEEIESNKVLLERLMGKIDQKEIVVEVVNYSNDGEVEVWLKPAGSRNCLILNKENLTVFNLHGKNPGIKAIAEEWENE